MKVIKKLSERWVYWSTIAACGWVMISRSLSIILRAKLGKLTDLYVNQITKQGAVKVLKLLKTQFNISYTHSLLLNDEQPCIFMSNHQSYIDPALIFATVMGQIRLIAKKELFDIPLFGKALALGGCIAIDRDHIENSIDFFQYLKEKLHGKTKWWIFPEGTRSRTGALLPFKTGIFRLARESGAKIIPVAIKNTAKVVPAGKFLPVLNQTVSIHIGEAIDARQYQSIEHQPLLIDKVRNNILELLRD